MESILKEHIVDHLYNHKLISKQQQHGFPARRSTTTQLECCRDWSVCMKSNKPFDVIYLDFAKAFDSVAHTQFLYKLKLYGISNMILKWLENVLIGSHNVLGLLNLFQNFVQYLVGYRKEVSWGLYCF